MSDTLEAAAAKLRERLGEDGFDSAVKFEIEGEGAILLNADGVSVGDGDADVTISADLDVFQDMFDGDLSPTAAFMTGKIKIDGDMGAAMKIAQLFA
jgi:putative sterol carrier protein